MRAREGKTPYARFLQQIVRAKSRRIGWELTFDQWMKMWTDSGHWNDRGLGIGKYVMARKGDVGPYSTDNAFICLFTQNISDAHRFNPIACGRITGSGRGWTLRKRASRRPYQVVLANKYIGSFATQAEAEAAYADAAATHVAAKNFAPTRTVQ